MDLYSLSSRRVHVQFVVRLHLEEQPCRGGFVQCSNKAMREPRTNSAIVAAARIDRHGSSKKELRRTRDALNSERKSVSINMEATMVTIPPEAVRVKKSSLICVHALCGASEKIKIKLGPVCPPTAGILLQRSMYLDPSGLDTRPAFGYASNSLSLLKKPPGSLCACIAAAAPAGRTCNRPAATKCQRLQLVPKQYITKAEGKFSSSRARGLCTSGAVVIVVTSVCHLSVCRFLVNRM